MGQLGDGGGFAAAVDADDQHHMGAGKGGDVERLGHGAQDGGNFLGHGLAYGGLVGAAIEPGLRKALADAGGGAGPEVGEDERVFQRVELRGFELCRADDAGEILGQAR